MHVRCHSKWLSATSASQTEIFKSIILTFLTTTSPFQISDVNETMNYKDSVSVLSLQASRQTQRQPVSSNRLFWCSSTRPACTWDRTSLDWPGIAWSTCDKRSHHARPINSPHGRRRGPGLCWESSLLGRLLPCIILWFGGAADAHLWLASFCFWLLDWGHQPVGLTALIGLMMMWRVQRRGAVWGGAT